MRNTNSLCNRIVALALCLMMIIGMMPANVLSALAVNGSTLTTDIDQKEFVVGEQMVFTFTTTANDDAGTYVLGTFEFSDRDAVEKLEYLEVQTGTWYEFYGDFGPATGFPMTDATSTFRVTFNKAGNYTVNAAMVTVEGRTPLCTATAQVTVQRANAGALTTNIGQQLFLIGRQTEFTLTTTANGDAGTTVRGNVTFDDASAVEKLEYYDEETKTWIEITGEYGPESGFAMEDANATFRVTFNKAGSYTMSATLSAVDGNVDLCVVRQSVTVYEHSAIVTNIGNVAFVAGEAAEFTVLTTANGHANMRVYGCVKFADSSAVEKLEYRKDKSEEWVEITEKFREEGFLLTDATHYFRVTFAKAGEQEMTVAIKSLTDDFVLCSAESTAEVEHAEQTGFAFLYPNPEDQWVGKEFKNEATGGQSGEQIIYEVLEGNAQVSATGGVKFKDTGKVLVRATRPGNEKYNDAVATYVVTAVAILDFSLKFTTSNPTITYTPNGTYQNTLENKKGSITYAIVEDGQKVTETETAKIDSKTGVVTVLKAGTVVVRATQAGSTSYKETTKEYTLTIQKADQENFCFGNIPGSVTWQAAPLDALDVLNGMGSGGLKWAITDGNDVAEVAQDGKITLKKVGTFTISVQKDGDDCYNPSRTIYATIEVVGIEQSGFGFDNGHEDEITFNDTDKNAPEGTGEANKYTLLVNGGQSSGNVVYEVESGDAVTVDQNGVITVLKAGTVVIKATRIGDDYYAAASDYFTLKVKKASQSFTFAHDKQISEKYGLHSFETKTILSTLNSGNISYRVSENQIGATINGSGVVSFGDSAKRVGEVTVTVTLKEDACYEAFSDTYTIKLEYEATPDDAYTLYGDKTVAGSDWFTGDVTIAAPNGYWISYSNELSNDQWENSVIWNKDGSPEFWAEKENKALAPVIYLKNQTTGAITDGISVSDLKRDTVKPSKLAISYQTSVFATIGEKLFGFSASKVKVTVSAEDLLSGIDKLEYSLDGGEKYIEIVPADGKYEFYVLPEYRGQLWMKATDVAGNTEVYKHVNGNTDQILIVDSTMPGLNVSYSGTLDENAMEGVCYANGERVLITFTVSDDNLDLRGEDPVVTVNGAVVDGWQFNDTTGTLTIELTEEGDYQIYAEFKDRLNRTKSYESEVRIDRAKPVIETNITQGRYYTEDQTFELKITEHNFDSTKVNLHINAVDSKGNSLLSEDEIAAYANMAKNISNWSRNKNGDVYTLKLQLPKDANYVITVDCTDALGQAADTYQRTFAMDKVNPDMPNVTFAVGNEKSELVLKNIINKLFGFAKETVYVTVESGDAVSGIDRLEYKIHDEDPFTKVSMNADGKYVFQLDPEYRGQLTFVVYDKAGRSTKYVVPLEIVVDSIAPEVNIEFTGERKDAVKADTANTFNRESMSAFDQNTRFVYDGNVTATIKVKEANFFPDNNDLTVKIYHDGKLVEELEAAGIEDSGWSVANGIYVRSFEMSADGDYQIIAEYADHSQNDMQWGSNEYDQVGSYHYESNIHTIDTTPPVYDVTYDHNDVVQTISGRDYYNENRTATICVTDRNFRPSDVVFTVKAVDVTGKQVEIQQSRLTSWSDWTSEDGQTWIATIPFEKDGNYTVEFSYTDIAGHRVESDYTATFTVDTVAPSNMQVAYRSKDDQIVNKIINAITFGHYKAGQEVVLTMTDPTAGIDYIKLTVTAQDPASATDLAMPEDLVVNADGKIVSGSEGFISSISSKREGDQLTLTFDVPAQFRGKVAFTAYDKAGNSSNSHEDPGVLVVDTIAPGYTVSYNPVNMVNVSDMKDMTDWKNDNGVEDITNSVAQRVMYFSGDAVATIRIEEANFDPSQVVIKVLNGKGEEVRNWTQSEWTTVTEEGKADAHTTVVTIADEGDYQIKVYYQDYSMNTPVDYLSQWIVVDKTAPVINVEYSNTGVKNTIDGRHYYAQAQTAIITIKERNFRADDVRIKVTAKNVLGQDVLALNEDGTIVKAYAEQGMDRNNWSAYAAGTWRRSDDCYVITLNFAADANYTFDVEYQDLAKNDAEDYAQDLFTVDTTAPTNLKISYSTNVFQEILESITFGYYNAKMTVTISAEDDTTGIYHFAYSYINSEGISGVNAELLDQAIRDAQIEYNGKTATATFDIPKLVLGSDNQFNGTVSFTAFDRSENGTQLKDSTRIIVDNISPTATITYNEPIRTVNGISYYAGNIDATIKINEANFDAKDVVVKVTKDGVSYPVNVVWSDLSVDVHTGTFTLTEDGDYTVSVEYQDKSGNQMTSYKSNQLTLDTVLPAITVSDIQANSANKESKYGFTITVNDRNLDLSSLNVNLKAVKQVKQNTYEIQQIDLGDATTVVEGMTYTYTVENLADDGLYTLICEVKDLAGNVMSQVVLDDGKSYSRVQFSINRNGSAFGYGDDFTENLVKQYFVYSVDADLTIVEVNVDPIVEYKVTLNGKQLTEGTDYTTEQSTKDGEWSKRTYTIKKELFAAEGQYNVIVSSVDKTATTAYSDIKNLSVAFVVDQTKPTMTITGLETGGRYQTDEQTVTLIPMDEGGRLDKLYVVAMDSDGNPLKDEAGNDISVRFDLSGDELRKYLEENDGKVTFTVPEGLNNQVQIICNDCAVNADDQTNEYTELFSNVTVSRNQLIIFYANKPLFFGTIFGVLLIMVIIVILIKRKKNDKEKAKA